MKSRVSKDWSTQNVTSVYMNRIICIQRDNVSGRVNTRRVSPTLEGYGN
jgi:hypothetical protein